jgi:hypothetical protein
MSPAIGIDPRRSSAPNHSAPRDRGQAATVRSRTDTESGRVLVAGIPRKASSCHHAARRRPASFTWLDVGGERTASILNDHGHRRQSASFKSKAGRRSCMGYVAPIT